MADLNPAPEDRPPPQVPARFVVQSAAALWLCYFVLITLRGVLVGLEFQEELALRRLLVIAAAFLITLMVWPVLRLVDRQRLWLRIVVALVIMLPPALLIATINHWAFAEVEAKMAAKMGEGHGIRIQKDAAGNMLIEIPDPPELPPPPGLEGPPAIPGQAGALPTRQFKIEKKEESLWQQLTDVALGRYFLLLAWAALYLALGYAEHARAAERREGEYRRAARNAELRSLRYQVNPHFLFNTLNSLSALVMTGKAEAAETMIQTISRFYRRSLAGDPTGDVPLEEEIRLQQLYLEIEAVRFPDRLRTAFAIPEALEGACVPGMILQPLVENSVKHAVAAVARPVTITFAAREEHGRLVVTIGDDGPGTARAQGWDDKGGRGDGCGIGLQNVRDRLAARFGTEASVVSGATGDGYATIIRLPMVRNGC